MPGDMKIQHLPKREFQAFRGAAGAKSYPVEDLQPKVTAGRVEVVPMPLALRLRVRTGRPKKGESSSSACRSRKTAATRCT